MKIKSILIISTLVLIALIIVFIRIEKPVCGDGVCQAGEDEENCPFDCGAGAVWEREITNIDVSPNPSGCLNSPTPTQLFSARLSKQAPGTAYKGTFLQLSGSPTTEYIFEINHPGYNARKKLEYELWKKGFRILEFKFSSKTGYNPLPGYEPDEQWRESGIVCETTPLLKALEILTDEGMWPENQGDRFAMGTSNGAGLLAYAIDFHKSPYARMNRVLIQSPVFYDVYSQCKEEPAGNVFSNFYFPEQCHNPDDYKESFFEKQQIKSKLNSENCGMTLGENSYLIVGGKKDEIPQWYKDEFTRYVPDREAVCPLQSASWDAPEIYNGHRPIEDYLKINRNIDHFVNYFLNGEIDFR